MVMYIRISPPLTQLQMYGRNNRNKEGEDPMIAAEISQIRWARLAGFLYLFTYVVPITGWTIAARYEVRGNFAETAHRIAASELFYRFGLSCLFLTCILCIFLAMGLYVALKPVNSTLALFGLLFRLAENVVGAVFAVVDFTMVKAYTGGDLSAVFTEKQLSAVTTLLAHAGGIEMSVTMVFLGIGSAFFFYLFLRSGYIPKVLSVYSLCAAPIFIGVSFACLLWPQYSTKLQMGWLPLALAEISLGLWLLIKGLKLHPRVEKA